MITGGTRIEIKCRALDIPFRVAFTHASATRSATQAIWVEARDADGTVGLGEGCPREYVTGESVSSALAFVAGIAGEVGAAAQDVASLRAWVSTHRDAIDRNPAAWCGIELALLDLLARRQKIPVEMLLGTPTIKGPFSYSAVLGAANTKQFAQTLARYQKVGMRDFKIKLSGDAARDRENLAVIQAAGISPTTVRADANNLWTNHDAAYSYLNALSYPFAALEEPLRAGQFAELARLADTLQTRIVLDESITREEQLSELPGEPEKWIVNIRVSKMGGLLRSLAVANRCQKQGLSVIVGAQVGETSLLSRAALTVVQSIRDSVLAQEGAFGTLLLETDAVVPTLMFGAEGRLEIDTFQFDQGPGFGMTVRPKLADN